MIKSFLSLLSVGLFIFNVGESAVLLINVDAPIHPITSEYIRQAIDRAERDNAKLLIIQLNTPGGLESSMREIISRILSSKVPIATYVSPSGARAASAGFFIGIASDLFVMAPGTNTGAAHPVSISLAGQQLDKTMEEKILQDSISYIKTIAEKRNRNIKAAEAAVRQSASYTEKEALENKLIDYIARDVNDLLNYFDGQKIRRFNGEEILLSLKDEPLIFLPMSRRQKFLITISNPNLAYLLLMLGLLGLYFEFSNPGAILPGVLGGISLLLAIFAFQILPINYVGLLLILLAIALLILEVKVHSYGILTVGGIVAMIIGSMMLVNSPLPELRPSLQIILPVAISFSLIFVFLVYLVVKAHMRRAITGREGLIGEIGTAQTDLNLSGKVFVHGEIWNAEADEFIPKGSKVQVEAVLDGLKIKVKKVQANK